MKIIKRATLAVFSALIIGPWIFPDTLSALVNSWWGLPPLFLFFAAFSVGVVSWGLLIEKCLGGGVVAAAPFGLAAAIFFAGLIGHLGGLQLPAPWLLPTALLIGLILSREEWNQLLHSLNWKKPWRLSWLAIIFGLAAFIRYYAAFLPAEHGDPLYYHLLGPRLWVEAGRISVDRDLPSGILAGAWEYLYLWPQVIWRSAGIEGLVAAQIFSQWLHLTFGWLGCAFVIYRMARPLVKNVGTAKFMALSALFASSVQWTGGLAKNDLGIAFLALSSICLILEFSSVKVASLKNLAAAGFLGGLALGGKINAGFVLAPFGFFYSLALIGGKFPALKKELGVFKSLLTLGLGAAFGAAPFFLRNYALTANPFYPLFGSHFPSPVMSQSWLDFVSMLNPSGETDRKWIALGRLKELSRENPMIWGWLLLPAFSIKPFRNAVEPFWILIATAAASFCLFAFAFIGNIELRHLGAGLVIISALGALFFWVGVKVFVKNPKAVLALRTLFVIALLACSHLPFHLLWQQYRYPAGVKFLDTHTAGRMKLWIRENIDPQNLVVSEVDNEMYYLPMRRMALVTDRPDIDKATYKKATAEEYLRGLCESSGSFLLLDARPGDGFEKRFPSAAAQMPILHEERGAKIYDLAVAEKALGWNIGCARNKAR